MRDVEFKFFSKNHYVVIIKGATSKLATKLKVDCTRFFVSPSPETTLSLRASQQVMEAQRQVETMQLSAQLCQLHTDNKHRVSE